MEILPIDFYGCPTWSLVYKNANKTKTFKKRVLRQNIGANKDEYNEKRQ